MDPCWTFCRSVAVSLAACLSMTLFHGRSMAGDWPQILGPHRNGVSDGERLAEQWPGGGPPLRWSRAVGTGNAGVAIVKGTGVLFHRVGDREVIAAFDPEMGENRWEHSYATSFIPQVGNDDGPLCVPSIHDGSVVTLGAQGVLTCCDLHTGEQIWQRRTHAEFEALPGYFGAGSSPLVGNGRVILNVGGHKTESGVVAFSLKDGSTLWNVTDDRASYAAPIATSVNGRPMVVCVTRLRCLGLDPADGSVRFELPFGRIGPTVNAAVPVIINGHLFLTASYGIGAVWARLAPPPEGVVELWRRTDVMSSQYTTPIHYEGHLYGIDGREDGPPASLVCVDPRTGTVRWSERGFGYATLLRGGDRLIICKTDGELILARPSPDSFQPLSRHRLTARDVRALPALAAGFLYLRDTQTLFCLDVGRPDRTGNRE